MNSQASSLEQLQRWMQTVITCSGGVAAGIASADARAALAIDRNGLQSVIPPSHKQSSLQRLGVYADAYYTRLLHCLREMFPVCRDTVGDDVFDDFAFGYLQQYPPRSYTLGKLAGNFVAFLDETRHEPVVSEVTPGSADDVESVRQYRAWTQFVVELARLEYVIDEVFDGPGTERDLPLFSEALASVPVAVWPSVRLIPVKCLRLLSFAFPVNEYFSDFRRGLQPEIPDARPTYLAINRRDYVVRRCPLDAIQHAVLSGIVAGATLGEALATVADQFEDFDALSRSVATWFSTWAREQFFARLEYPPQ